MVPLSSTSLWSATNEASGIAIQPYLAAGSQSTARYSRRSAPTPDKDSEVIEEGSLAGFMVPGDTGRTSRRAAEPSHRIMWLDSLWWSGIVEQRNSNWFSPLIAKWGIRIVVLHRLIHSLVVVGLSVGYETWPPIDWHHIFVIGWSKCSWDCLSRNGFALTSPMEISIAFQRSLAVPLHSPNGRQMPVVRAVQGDRERV